MNNILNIVTNTLKKYSNNQINADEHTPINSFNIDSLDFLEFQMSIDEKFNIEIPIERFLECESIGDVVRLVEEFIN